MLPLPIASVSEPVFAADWQVPAGIKTCLSTRHGGISTGVYASLNVGAHVGDEPAAVAHNRAMVQQAVAVPLAYLNQIHSTTVVPATVARKHLQDADASVDASGKAACAVMTADCLPVLLCDEAATVVGAAHAGWRGLVGGVIENTITAMQTQSRLIAYLGPAIGPDAFEVGAEVRAAFLAHDAAAASAFVDIGNGKYLADIYALARQRLQAAGVEAIYGGEYCTVLQRNDFFSYRRDGQTGRMVSAIWLE